ncbi:hypothetical protein ACPXAZ_26115, partial [Escherichia coli]|uniref:hypothetical protein n=1 Tax=Escherichia coli TaxID=562 RepID=UPI003CE5854C
AIMLPARFHFSAEPPCNLMSQEQHNAAPKPGRWALCWRFARGSYRRLNRATHHVLGFTLKLLLAAYFVFCALF